MVLLDTLSSQNIKTAFSCRNWTNQTNQSHFPSQVVVKVKPDWIILTTADLLLKVSCVLPVITLKHHMSLSMYWHNSASFGCFSQSDEYWSDKAKKKNKKKLEASFIHFSSKQCLPLKVKVILSIIAIYLIKKKSLLNNLAE